ncbi:MAG: polyprenyl synthetase family protein [Candidatus Thermoplasmatota archaeon]|nr:polyprenyl synthetase family protein [Candidatus Thermoplasmatota archaeon]
MDLENTLREKAKIFDRALNGALTPKEPKIIYDAIRWIPLSGGKRLRPIIAMLSCEAVGGRSENTIPLGIALECLHNATLIHDDIIDGDKWRRGLQTTNEKFGLPLAIVAGDGLIGETYRMLSYMAPPELKSMVYKEIIRSIADAAKRLYEGEAMDIEFDTRYDVTIPEYMLMIEKKTAQLYWLAGKGGALIGKGSNIQVENLARYGVLFGMMFQIKDDLLNILTDQASLGKQTLGSDIINGKCTLMLVHSLQHADKKDREKIISILNNKKITQIDVKKIIEIFRETGSIDFSQNKLKEFSEKAKQCLIVLKKSESKEILTALAEYSVIRSY